MKCFLCPQEIKTTDRFVWYSDKSEWAHFECAVKDAYPQINRQYEENRVSCSCGYFARSVKEMVTHYALIHHNFEPALEFMDRLLL